MKLFSTFCLLFCFIVFQIHNLEHSFEKSEKTPHGCEICYMVSHDGVTEWPDWAFLKFIVNIKLKILTSDSFVNPFSLFFCIFLRAPPKSYQV